MATTGLGDQDRLEGSSNHIIRKARMSFLLDEHALKSYPENIEAEPTDEIQLK